MFKICELSFCSKKTKEVYRYEFNSGINYFVGKNNSGKTEFYTLLDYMLGASDNLKKMREKECYKDVVDYFSMKIDYDGKIITLKRTLDSDANYIETEDGEDEDFLSLDMYQKRLNSFFTKDESSLRDLREFTGEDISYRIFTMFNFLSEDKQGYTENFLSKCSETKYWLRQDAILNYLFNKNLAELRNKEAELKDLTKQLSDKQKEQQKNQFIQDKINSNLQKLSINIQYNGFNADKIKKSIADLKTMEDKPKAFKEKNIADLEAKYNSIHEQIKQYNNEIKDVKEINKDNTYRIKLIENLIQLSQNNPELKYLVEPSVKILNDLNNTVSFGSYITKDETVKKLNKELIKVKNEINKNDSKFEIYSLDEKKKAVAVVEEYLESGYKFINIEEINDLQSKIRQLKDDIRELKNDDSNVEIENFSTSITSIYLSGRDSSNFILNDSERKGFKIRYAKKGNVLQPKETKTFIKDGKETDVEVNYFPGSMARHTAMQLCGYLTFLKKMLSSDKFPIIPFLVIDHISKSFDDDNKKAIGSIINAVLNDIGKDKLQIFMFDTEQAEAFGIDSACSKDLIEGDKTGFCPFYKS